MREYFLNMFNHVDNIVLDNEQIDAITSDYDNTIILAGAGAGKTTTFRMIMGLLDSSAGEITLDGKKIDYSVTDKIGFLTEERSLLPKLTVKEQLLFYGALKNMSDEEILKRSEVLLERFGIKDYLNRKIKELSKGNQQKVQFISAIINEPELLIFSNSSRVF